MIRFIYLLVICVFINNLEVQTVSQEKNYASLISSIRSLYDASSVVIVQNHLTKDIGLLSKMIKELSFLGISSQAATFLKLSKINSYQHLYVVILTTSESVEELENFLKDMYVSEPSWLIIFATYEEQNLLNDFCLNPKGNPFNLRFNTKMIVKCYHDPNLREWYSLYKNDTQIFDLASWNSTHGFQMFIKDRFLYSRRNNVGGISLRVTALNNSALIGDFKKLDGYFSKILGNISQTMNLKLNVTVVNSISAKWNEYGGLVAKLFHNETDIAVANMVMTKGRLDYVDFATPMSISRLILCLKETNLKKQHLEYFKTFHYHIWIVICLFIITVPVLLTLMNVYINSNKVYNWKNNFCDNCFNVWRMFCLQGSTEFPTETPLRLTWFTIFASALFLSLVYSGSLINYLTINSQVPTFTTLESFINDGTYKLVVLKNKYVHSLIKNESSTKGELLKLRPLLKNDNELPENEFEAFKEMCSSRTAYLTVKETIESTNLHLYCKFKWFELADAPKYMSYALAKRNPYLELINYHIIRLSNSGYLQYLSNNLKKMKYRKEETDNHIDTSGFVLISQILITGTSVSFLIFFAEVTCSIYYKKKNLQKC